MSTGLFHVVVDATQSGQRLDRILAEAADAAGLGLSRTRLQRLIEDGHVHVDGRPVRSVRDSAPVGAIVAITVPEPAPATPVAQTMALTVVFEDEHLLVLDKPAGLVVHPAAGHADGTLVNALIAHCGDSLSGIGGVRRPGIVHRLDKDTSGLMVVAKSDAAHAGLTAIFADHGRSGSLVREYTALVWGVPAMAAGAVDAPIGRDPHARLKMAVVSDRAGRRAVTHWRRCALFGTEATEIACRLETGRTHQIRVHLASLGHPLIGDAVYGAGFRTKIARLPAETQPLVLGLPGQALHARSLGFTHPVTGETLLFEAALPPGLAALRSALATLPAIPSTDRKGGRAHASTPA